jgi:hypothetical protein
MNAIRIPRGVIFASASVLVACKSPPPPEPAPYRDSICACSSDCVAVRGVDGRQQLQVVEGAMTTVDVLTLNACLVDLSWRVPTHDNVLFRSVEIVNEGERIPWNGDTVTLGRCRGVEASPSGHSLPPYASLCLHSGNADASPPESDDVAIPVNGRGYAVLDGDVYASAVIRRIDDGAALSTWITVRSPGGSVIDFEDLRTADSFPWARHLAKIVRIVDLEKSRGYPSTTGQIDGWVEVALSEPPPAPPPPVHRSH